jgi:hypothetical protein
MPQYNSHDGTADELRDYTSYNVLVVEAVLPFCFAKTRRNARGLHGEKFHYTYNDAKIILYFTDSYSFFGVPAVDEPHCDTQVCEVG